MIRAAGLPSVIHGVADSSGDVKFIEAAGGADGAKLKTFSGVAYTGGKMSVGYGHPVVIDLAGLTAGAASIPALKDHDATQIVGHLTADIGKRAVKVNGVVSGRGDARDEVVELSGNDFPWQMSVGVMPDQEQIEFVDRGKSEVVNGKKVDGPAYVVRAGKLVEVSFVAVGADSSTSGKVAASSLPGASEMNPFEKWLEASGWDKSKLSAAQVAQLQATYDAEIKAKETPKPEPTPAPKVEATADPVLVMRASLAAESARVATITTLTAKHPDIQAKAIGEGWDATKTELEVLRASRPAAPGIHVHAAPCPTNEVLTCAMSRTLGHTDTEKRFKPATLEACDNQFKRGIGIKQLLLITASANGMPLLAGEGLHQGNIREVLEYAFPPRGIRAGFSTVSLPSILENVANKTLLDGYMEEDQTWREIAQIVSVSDFKDAKAYRMLDDMEYEELSPAGEIKNGTVGEETITRNVDTFAKMFSLTRKQVINDDMGAFDDLKNRLGRGRAQKFNKVFWTNFLANHSTFFTAARTNYVTGATTTLAADGVGLALGVLGFRKMTSPSADGTKRVGLGATPSILLVPPELEGVAEVLFRNQNLGGVKSSDANIYANKYRPVVQNRLSDSAFTGYSTICWYLFGAVLKPMWAAFLNGNETPTVESTEADFNTLGIQFRGYHDFNADQNEYLAGIKSKAAA